MQPVSQRSYISHMRGRAFTAILACACLLLPGCPTGSIDPALGPPEPGATQAGSRYTIVTTTGMVTDLVRQIAGEHAEIVGLMGEGIDPHLYRPTTQDSARLMQADFVLYSGLKLEGQMGAALELARKQGRQIVAVTDGLPPDEIRYPSGAVGHPDPHVWHDPVLWGECARRVAIALGEYDPVNATEYSRRAAEVHAECTRFHEHAAQVLGAIPEQQRHLVTAHDAFEYFARRYGLTVHSVQGITTESEPGLQDTNALVDFLVDQKIPALFVETTVNPDHLKAVIEGAAARDWEVSIGGTLYSDAMGAPGTREGTYLGMLDHNVVTIARELGSTWEGPLSFFDVAEDSKMETENHTTAAPKLE